MFILVIKILVLNERGDNIEIRVLVVVKFIIRLIMLFRMLDMVRIIWLDVLCCV